MIKKWLILFSIVGLIFLVYFNMREDTEYWDFEVKSFSAK